MRRESQMPPMDPAAMGGAMPPMDPMAGGMPPMDPTMGMGGAPMGAPAGPPPEQADPPIPGALSSIGEILYDFDIDKFIASHSDMNEDDLAKAVWEAYGGLPNGQADDSKKGTRDQNASQRPPDVVAQEVQSTQNQKWMRLPLGKGIADLTSVEEIKSMMKAMIYGMVKKYSTPPAPPGGAGAMPPM